MHGNRKTSNMTFEEDQKNSLRVLKQGGIILYPTDTVWGIGCDATNNTAVEKIFRIKTRETSKSLIILVDGIGMLERYVKTIPQTASELTSVSDSPLTIIYPDGKNLAAGICSEDGSVGIRICNEPFCNELITRFRRPVVSTSANISGKLITGELVTDTFDCSISGSGNVVIASGSADRGDISISGSGSYSGAEFKIDNLEIIVSGSGSCLCKAGDSLTARISGSGNVTYKGDPKIDARVSGSGHVRPAK